MKFSLQSVLDVRHSRLEAIELEMAQAQAMRAQHAAALAALDDQHTRLLDDLRRLQTRRTLDLGALTFTRSTLARTENEIRAQRLRLAEAEARVTTVREALVIAKQDEETLMTLKDRAIEAETREENRKAEIEVDDLNISRAFRKSKARGAESA